MRLVERARIGWIAITHCSNDRSVLGHRSNGFGPEMNRNEPGAIDLHLVVLDLEPAATLTVDLSPSPAASGGIGEVADARWIGLQHRRLGTAQAWASPADRLLVLWECVLDDWVRRNSPLTDPVLTTVWSGFERVLTLWFPQAVRIATPSWEDLYERPAWQQFLAGQGYEPITPGCFAKQPPQISDSQRE